MNSQTHLTFGHRKFRNILWTNFHNIFKNVGDEERKYGFFQQDGAIIHIANNLIAVLYNIFGDLMISCPMDDKLFVVC